MKVLISDANVLIDMEVGGLIQPMFQLPYQFHTPDILFEEELDEQHAYLLEMGLIKAPLSSDIAVCSAVDDQISTAQPQ